jgi:hypothetical protein
MCRACSVTSSLVSQNSAVHTARETSVLLLASRTQVRRYCWARSTAMVGRTDTQLCFGTSSQRHTASDAIREALHRSPKKSITLASRGPQMPRSTTHEVVHNTPSRQSAVGAETTGKWFTTALRLWRWTSLSDRRIEWLRQQGAFQWRE